MVAPTRAAVGGHEEDGRPQVAGPVPHQLHRDTQTVLSCGKHANHFFCPDASDVIV